MICVSCVKMDYGVQDGEIPRDLSDFDFAEDALDFECQLSEAQNVKFSQLLEQPLAIGSHIVCTGTPNQDIPWFALNIYCGSTETGRSDIAVHFNVRVPQCYVVRNSRRNGKWGPEETTSFRLFPFKPNRPFTLEMLVDEKETLWAVDGEFYCSYAHRNPDLFSASWLEVIGLKDATLNVKKTDIFPLLATPLMEVQNEPSMGSVSLENGITWRPNVIAKLSGGIPEGHQLVIQGRFRRTLHSFAIDLMDTARDWPRPNILLHLNVRAFDESQKERQLVVLNTWHGAWASERRQRTARLIPNTKTTFRIVRGPGEWCIYDNNILIGELEYRGSPAGVAALRIRGDLYPSRVYVCPASDSPIENITSSLN